MLIHKNIFVYLSFALLAVGCQNGAPTKTQKDQAQKQWSDARAGVMGTLAQDQYRNGNFEKCEATLGEALRLQPDNANLHLLGARLAIEQGGLEVAQGHIERARKLDPKNPEVDYLSGVVLQRWQQPQKAYESYDAAMQKNPGEICYLMAKAETLVALNRPAEALSLLQSKVVYFEHSGAIRDAAGQLLVQQGRAAEGAQMLRQASILATEDLTIREHFGLALFYAKEYVEAADVLGRLLKDKGYAGRADLHAALGECQTSLGDLQAARQSLSKAVELNPGCAAYLLNQSRLAIQLNDLPRADIAVRRAIAVDPSNAQSHCLLGYIQLRQAKLRESLASFKTAVRLDPADTVSLSMQGYIMQKLGNSQQAVHCYSQALKINPQDELASQLMASANSPE